MPVMGSAPGAKARIDGREVLYFAGTGYLGLQGDARVVEAGCAALREFGLHPATTRSGFGETPLLLAVEQRAAQFFGTESARYFVSGYAGMAILAQGAAGTADLILADEWLHHAGHDAAALLGAPLEHFRHGDADDLRAMLRAHGRRGRVLVMCDGVSPVRGDVAPINAYLDVLAEHGAGRLVVDDAHGVGVLGRHGRGSVEHAADAAGMPIAVNEGFDLDPARQVWMCGTLSKAIGGSGGIIPGSTAFVAGLKTRARFLNGAAASPSPVAGATAAALEICLTDGFLRERLSGNVTQLRSGLRKLGLDVADLPTPIICLPIGDGDNMARIQKGLMDAGMAVAHSRNYPGVDQEGALRIAVFATHTPAMIEELIEALRGLL
jgi:8-amino-7-oxononanoate synthase